MGTTSPSDSRALYLCGVPQSSFTSEILEISSRSFETAEMRMGKAGYEQSHEGPTPMPVLTSEVLEARRPSVRV